MNAIRHPSHAALQAAEQARRLTPRNASRWLLGAAVACTMTVGAMAQAREPAQGMPTYGSDATARASAAASDSAESVTAFGPKRLVDTYMAIGPSTIPLSGPLTLLDSSTVTCPGNVNCTIGLESMVQLHPKGSNWSICLKVDGIAPSCQLQGTWGMGGNGIVVGNARGALQNLTPGPHTVTTEVFVQNVVLGQEVYFFHTDYRVYKQ